MESNKSYRCKSGCKFVGNGVEWHIMSVSEYLGARRKTIARETDKELTHTQESVPLSSICGSCHAAGLAMIEPA